MFFFFFFFSTPETDKSLFKKGTICEIISQHNQHPLFAKDVGRKIVIAENNSESELMWAHDARPARYRTNRNGKRVCEYDPKCVLSLYSYKHLRILSEKEARSERDFMKDSW